MRFYFDINDKLPIRDQVGRDFGLVSEAVVFATYLAADLRCLEPDIRPQVSVRVIGEGLEQIHEEAVFTWARLTQINSGTAGSPRISIDPDHESGRDVQFERTE